MRPRDSAVRVASEDFVRIDEYRRLAAERSPNVVIGEAPCRGGETVAGYGLRYTRQPGQRETLFRGKSEVHQ